MKKILFILHCLAGNICLAQTLTIDLSKNLNQTFTQTIEPQELKQLILTNKVLTIGVTYSIDIKKVHVTTPPIAAAGLLGGAGGVCKPLNDATDALSNQLLESGIPDDIIKLKEEIDKAATQPTCATDIENAKKLIVSTSEYINLPSTIDVRSGDKVTVTITKDKNTIWTYVFQTEKISHSNIYYGFSYLFSDALTTFPTYYAESDTGSTFLLKKSNSTTSNVLENIGPTFMYTYLFFRNPDAPIKFGLTGGLMVDLSNPSIMFSPSLVIGDNLSLNFGVAVCQKNQLKGKFGENQRLNDNLDFDQLHNKVYTYDLFISVGYHFDKNPFKKEADTSQ